MEIQSQVAHFIESEAEKLISKELYEIAKQHILDTLGVSLGAYSDEITDVLINYTKAKSDHGSNTIIGSHLKSSVEHTAFINGVLAHAIDFDDNSYVLLGHPSAVVLPAVLAVAEKMNATGEKLLNSYIIGTEVSCKLASLATEELYNGGWHSTSVVGVLGATAGAGYLLELTEDEMTNALGIAASSASGLKSNFGSMTKPFHAGLAAQNGVRAALLAKQGFTSGTNTLERDLGYFSTYAGILPKVNIAEKLGKPFVMMDPGFDIKPYPSCAATHTAIDAVLKIVRDNNFRANDVKKIVANTGQLAKLILIHDRPQRGFEGKFSMPFVLAAGIVDGKVNIDSFTDEKVNSPQIRELIEKVEFNVHAGFNDTGLKGAPSIIEVHLKNGQVFSEKVEHATGTPQNPMSSEDLKQKYTDCASRVLDEENINKSIEKTFRLEELTDISDLMIHFQK